MQPAVSSMKKLLNKKLNIYPDSFTLKTDLKKDLELVDWELLYLFNVVEDAWHVSIPPADSACIIRVEHLLAAIKKQQGSNLQ